MPAGWKHHKGKNVYQVCAMCMTIGYSCKLSCISRLLLVMRLMSHLLSCFEVHLYHLFPHGCLQGRVGGCGWGGSVITSGLGEAYEQMVIISHGYMLTNTQLSVYIQRTASHTSHTTAHALIDMYNIRILVPTAIFAGTRCHANCSGCRKI